MSGEGNAIALAAGAAAVEKTMDRIGDVRDEVRGIKRRVGTLEGKTGNVQIGDSRRAVDGRVRDFEVGLCFPDTTSSGEDPSPFATAPSVIARPYLTEDQAASPTTYPGTVNAYETDGELVNPSAAMTGQNFGLGVAMGFAETRAKLMGATGEGVPSIAKLRHIFRNERGLISALEILEAEGISQQRAIDAWLRHFRGDSSVLWRLLENSATLNLIGVGVFAAFTLKANSLKVGDVATLRFSMHLGAGAVNSNITPRVQLTNASGPTIWAPYGALNPNALALANECWIPAEVRITRRADIDAVTQAFAIGGSIQTGSDTIAGGMVTGTGGVFTMNHTIDQVIALTGQFSAAVPAYLNEASLIVSR
jgi:hypothetical protein